MRALCAVNPESAVHTPVWRAWTHGTRLACLAVLLQLASCDACHRGGVDAASTDATVTGDAERRAFEVAQVEAAPLSTSWAGPLPSAGAPSAGFSAFPGGTVEWGRQVLPLRHAFEMQQLEVTQSQYLQVMGTMPEGNEYCPECPVAYVGWQQAMEYANRLSIERGLEPCWPGGNDRPPLDPYACEGYRLPTSLEWGRVFDIEYGEQWRDGSNLDTECAPDTLLDNIAWYCANSGLALQPVGQLECTTHSMCDMIGNVSEWLWDTRGCRPEMDPAYGFCPNPQQPWRPFRGSLAPFVSHEVSGGSYQSSSTEVGRRTHRSSLHGWAEAHSAVRDVGFRLARTLVRQR